MNSDLKATLRTDTNRWLELDNLVVGLKKKIKELEKQKVMLADKIIDVMDEFEISDLNINNHQLKCKVTKQKQSMSKKFLLQNLTTFYNGNLEKAVNTIDFLESKRGHTTRVKLLQNHNRNLITDS